MKLNFLLLLVASVVSGSVAEGDGKRLIKTNPSTPAAWLDESSIMELLQSGTHFFDITEVGEIKEPSKNSQLHSLMANSIPQQIRFPSLVKDLTSKINIERMRTFLTKFSGFFNRYYSSKTGVESSDWLASQLVEASSNYLGRVNVTRFSHKFPQKSTIVTISGSDPALSNEIVVMGAHIDSINIRDVNGLAPGADDDGTGTTNNLEAFRILMSSNFIPKRTVEFHFYAGEEKGLLGSQDIAKQYKAQNKKVVSMVQFDMTGYLSSNKKIALINDYTNPQLTNFLKNVIDNYCSYGRVDSSCGYGCSDHASWNKYGYPSAFPFEDRTNPNIHSTKDTLEFVNFTHMQEYVKIALGYIVEVSEPAQ